MGVVRMLIPKGRIYENVTKIFDEAGIRFKLADRAYRPSIDVDWLDAKIMKPQNVGQLLQIGSHDAGFTGLDWVVETSSEVVEIMDLGLDRVRIVAAVPNELDDKALRSKKIVVATEYVAISEAWLKKEGYDYQIVRTHGATEVFPPDDADMIIDNTSTGATLKENGLRIVGTLLESSTRFVASKQAMADPFKKEKIGELAMLFKAVLDGRERVMLEMNVVETKFDELVEGLPAMRSPTVSPLLGDSGYAVKIAVKRSEVPALLPKLKALGATDIVEYDLRKAVL